MKKEYTAPRMKVRTISPVRMLCTSIVELGDTNMGSRYNGSLYDYIGGEGDGGYGYSNNPD